MKKKLVRIFEQCYRQGPDVFVSAPGRINIIGEHTDYNNGYVLPAAIDRRIFFLASVRHDDHVHLYSMNFEEEAEFSSSDIRLSANRKWPDYVKAILWVLQDQGCRIKGFNGLISGDIPIGAGLSSSAALEVCILKGLADLLGLQIPSLTMATLAQKAENDFIGMKCGLMDQFISVFAEKDHAVFLDCETLEHRMIPMGFLNQDSELFVYDSGVERSLISSEYNRRREESAEALVRLRPHGVHSFKDLTMEVLDQHTAELGETLFKRARHVVSENQRVLAMITAIQNKDSIIMGNLLRCSHESLRDDYEVSCPELDLLYEVIKEHRGGFGARLTGAGFGGSGIGLVKKGMVSECRDVLVEKARESGFAKPSLYPVHTDRGVCSHLG
jgi:galactokinase